MRRREIKLVTSYRLLVASFKFLVFILSFSFLVFSFSFARAYPIDNTGAFSGLGTNQANQIGASLNELIKSIFGSRLNTSNVPVVSSDISKFVPKGYGLTFEDLINVKSFSTNDISGSLRAVGILFIKLVITTLSVTLGIFKLTLDLLVQRR